MPRRAKKKALHKRRRKSRQRQPAQRQRRSKSSKKPKLVTYEFRNPALDGSFTIELPAGWRGGRIFVGKPKPPPR